MSSRDRLACWLSGQGVRIGTGRPAPRVAAGVGVRVLGDLPDASLAELTDGSQDFVIADHVLHRVGDPTRHLEQMLRVVRPGGALYIALPDARTGVDAERLAASGAPIPFHAWRPDSFLDYLSALRTEAHLGMELTALEPCRPGFDDEFICVFFKGKSEIPPPPPVPGQVDPAHSRSVLAGEVERVRSDIRATEDRVRALTDELTRRDSDVLLRAASVAQRGARAILPRHSRRGRALTRAVRAGLLLVEQGPGAVARRIREGR